MIMKNLTKQNKDWEKVKQNIHTYVYKNKSKIKVITEV